MMKVQTDAATTDLKNAIESRQYRITHMASADENGVDLKDKISHIIINDRSLCGKERGKQSIRWSEYDDFRVTCLECVRIYRETQS